MAEKLKVFLCHASENKPIVKDLYNDLVAAGYNPWLDSEVLLPGMDWDREIKLGLDASDAVIVCVSSVLVDKEGYIQKELRLAQEHAMMMRPGTIFLIPLRLDDCPLPYELKDIQWGDYFATDGFERLVQALNIRAKQKGRELGVAKKNLNP
ncbi:MAG: toll/interleukin-1 receptor domain-containing protein [Anaerolineales bacterium]